MTPAPSADEQLIRLAIRARGDMARMGALIHGLLAVIALVLLAMGGQPLPFSLGAAGLGAVAIWLELTARKRRDARSAPLRALLHEPGKVEKASIESEESGIQVVIFAAGASDYVCPPGSLDELLAMLRRRCPGVVIEDHR